MSATQSKEKIRNGKTSAYYGRQRGGYRSCCGNRALMNQLVNNRQTIVIPYGANTPFSFTGERGDARYLRLMALAWMNLRLNISDSNADASHEMLLSGACDGAEKSLKGVLADEASRVKGNSGGSVFYPKDVSVWPDKGIVDVSGDLQLSYGLHDASPVKKHYRLRTETRVEPSRLSRLFEEWERYGLIERPDLEMDPVTGFCMPRHIVLTDRFWQLCGINMDKFLAERNERLAAEADGIIEPGTHASVRAARRRWYEHMRMATLISRRDKASRHKRRKRLSKLPVDDRRNVMAKLLRARPIHEWKTLPPEDFDRLVWKCLRQLELGLDYEPVLPQIPDVVH